MGETNPNVDGYFANGCGRCSLVGTPNCKAIRRAEELALLRRIVLECDLNEELKWKMPCYTNLGRNILIVGAFKEYSAVSFFNGGVLSDPKGILVQPTENTQTGRQLRYTSPKEILENEAIIKEYIAEAIAAEKAGLKVTPKKQSDYELPEELISKLDEMPDLLLAWEALTPGRQRGYILYFSAPKQSQTRKDRIEKMIPQIFLGKGHLDRY